MIDLLRLLAVKICTLPFVFVCLTVHEFSHGWVAYKLGDNTAKQYGRLSLNPLKHIDWMGVIAMLLLGFGWAKPVPVNPYAFRKGGAKGIVWVSLAGPVSNIIFAFVLLLLWYLCAAFAPEIAINFYFREIFLTVISMNIGLAVFNLIPVPPLDGSGVLKYFLPYNATRWMEKNSNILYMILLLAVFTGALSRVIGPVSSLVFEGLEWVARNIVGIFA